MLNQLDRTFQAFGDPTRRAIVERLADGPASVSELAAPLPMSLPAVMLHLKVLEESGLVVSEKKGRVRTCRIEPQMLSQAERWVGERRRMWERNLDRLGAVLDETAEERK
jgi:DNA-binding transcriptional ArsR family regulator